MEKVLLYRCPTPTCTLLKANYWPASMLGPRQLALSVEFLFEILYVGAPPQLALPVEFHFEILYVGAPDFN
ncbi:hypothetical protein B8A02_07025 [Staphylococcus aureus]|nr:hypothetical protein B8A02_07025 [Staphylococcus aureus]